VTEEIAEIRGIRAGVDCVSPSRHAEFSDVDSMLDWVELLAAETGLPVGIKSAVGDLALWKDLAAQMSRRDRGVDFVTIDGGEGGTGAAPLVFSDSVSLPFRVAFSRVYRVFAEAGLTDDVTFIGGGKLGLPDNAIVAMTLGCDMLNIAREPMLSIGCIQAQKCHTDRCPTGVATQDPWLAHGLDPQLKSVRAANYIKTLRRDLLKVAESCGVAHPALITTDDVEVLYGDQNARHLWEVYGYEPGWGQISERDADAVRRIMAGAPEGGSAPPSATAQG
jgi:glutamate synthase domain-containing protein 2